MICKIKQIICIKHVQVCHQNPLLVLEDIHLSNISLNVYLKVYLQNTLSVLLTGWTVQWNPTVHLHNLYAHYAIVHPILLYHGKDG